MNYIINKYNLEKILCKNVMNSWFTNYGATPHLNIRVLYKDKLVEFLKVLL